MIIDTHCHLNDESFDVDREDVIKNLQNNNIESAFIVGTDFDGLKTATELANRYDNIFAIVGMYPEYCKQYDDKYENALVQALKNPKVVAVGEIGLDFHSDGYDQNMQEELFARQIKIADRFGLPVSIHTRDAFDRTLAVLKENKQFLHGGVIHCFSGSPEIAKKFVKLGFKLGFGGVCTFQNAKKVVDTLKAIDVKDILLETDSPYLAPTPNRGKRNEPKYTNFVLDKISEIRGQTREFLEEQIFKNTLECFGRYKDFDKNS